ncbi:MAG: sulfotransferase domain-containing protein, partial [Pseudomonadota bacterium]|nr:sulfotransferase domain-containing protein [Pseudomonadota bacterium]
FDNFRRKNTAVPRVLFTHGFYLGDRMDSGLDRGPGISSPLVFLVRDPRDVAVSEYFQSTKRAKAHKRELYGVEQETTMFDFVMHGPLGLPSIIEYLNRWHNRLNSLPVISMVRYEQMRAEPVAELARICEFYDAGFAIGQIEEAVAFADFDNLKAMERRDFFHNSRLAPVDVNDPDSFKVRRAKVGGYRDYFDLDQIRQIDRMVTEELDPFFGYTASAVA